MNSEDKPMIYFPRLPQREADKLRELGKIVLSGLGAILAATVLAWAATTAITELQRQQPIQAQIMPTEPSRAVPVPIRGRILAVHDGDTCTVAINVRLAEIDAPELKQPYGAEARTTLAALLPPPTGKKLGATCTLRIDTIDRYGRAVGYLRNTVNLIDTDTNLQMVQRGTAWQYDTYSKDKNYATAEEDARHNKRGLWQQESPQPPWEFRRRVIENPFKEVPPDPDES